jgi:hypothetical protein
MVPSGNNNPAKSTFINTSITQEESIMGVYMAAETITVSQLLQAGSKYRGILEAYLLHFKKFVDAP